MNYTYTDTGIVTSDPQIACMFFGKPVCMNGETLADVWWHMDHCMYGSVDDDDIEHDKAEITIPYPLIADAIKPVDGKPCFLIYEHIPAGFLQGPIFMTYIAEYKPVLEKEGYILVAANPLTTVNKGQLCELIARTEAKAEEG